MVEEFSRSWVFVVDAASLPVGREFLEDHVKVVSATKICLGGASANGVRRSEGELTEKVAIPVPARIHTLSPLGHLSLAPRQ